MGWATQVVSANEPGKPLGEWRTNEVSGFWLVEVAGGRRMMKMTGWSQNVLKKEKEKRAVEFMLYSRAWFASSDNVRRRGQLHVSDPELSTISVPFQHCENSPCLRNSRLPSPGIRRGYAVCALLTRDDPLAIWLTPSVEAELCTLSPVQRLQPPT